MSDEIRFDPNCHRARWLGYFDLLGTRQLINTGNYIGIFCVYARAVEEAKRRTEKWAEIRHTCFSDTFLIYSENDTASDFVAMDMVARWFVHFLIIARIPVRGAIACGDFYADGGNNLYFGKALVEAYEYGEAQDRIGYLICPSAVARMSAVGLPADELLNYAYSEIPFKEGKKPQNAVPNLPSCILGDRAKINGDNQCLRALREMMEEANDETIVRKYANTISFIESNQRSLQMRQCGSDNRKACEPENRTDGGETPPSG